jgi:hypothetical protein
MLEKMVIADMQMLYAVVEQHSGKVVDIQLPKSVLQVAELRLRTKKI